MRQWPHVLPQPHAKHGVERPGQFIDDGDAALLSRAESGLRSITMTVFPMATKALHRSPSSRGTRMTSLSRMPSRWQALVVLESWDCASGAWPRTGTSNPSANFRSFVIIENGFHAFWGAVEDVHFNRA